MTLNLQNKGFSEIFAISGCDNISIANCAEMDLDNLYDIFSIKRTFLRI